MRHSKTIHTIDEYIALFPEEKQNILQKIRDVVQTTAPDATEAIRYGMPTFRLKGNMLHFAAFKNHIGFYPTPSAIIKFKEALNNYNTSKGAIRFALDKPVPYNLIRQIVTFRVSEQNAKP